MRIRRLLVISFLSTLLAGKMGVAAELKIIASGAIKEPVEELAPTYENETGHKLRIDWASTVEFKRRVAEGEPFDAIIVSANDLASIERQGKIVPQSVVRLMRVGVGIGVKQGATKPTVNSKEALKAALLSAQTIGYSTGPSGVHIESLISKFGLMGELKGKLVQAAPGVPVGQLIADGKVDIGFQQISELIHFPGVAFVGPLPLDVQNETQYAGGLHSSSKQADAVKNLFVFLLSTRAAPAIERAGMQQK